MYGYGLGYGYGMGIPLDPTYILVLIGAIISIFASMHVQSTYQKYARVRSMTGMTGAQAAEHILHQAGIYDVRVEHIHGNLTDHYDPRAKVVRLSDATYNSASVAAVGVAAHECGHVMQHANGYKPLVLRTALVPVANFGSKLGIPLIIIGALMSYNQMLISIGIWVFALAVLFQVVTLPVEFDASHRAVVTLDQQGILQGEEVGMCRKVLGAAALTYVAAAASSILTLLRLIILFGGNRRRD